MRKYLSFFLLGSLVSLPVIAQNQPRPLVTETIDEGRLTSLHGTVHPLAQAAYDRGAVNESTPADRMMLVLNRPPDREAAFQQLLKDMHTPGSPSYHRWLTPEEMGSRFGPADADLNAVSGWLASSGFQVNRVSKARQFVEFSGTVGQVNTAFHTQIRQYMVNGVLHHANASDVQIPEALGKIIGGVSPLHDFRPAPRMQPVGSGHYEGGTQRFVPDFNLPSDWTPLLYGLVPADFYTEYDLSPLYAAKVNGTGATIGIIDESNIDLDVVNAYRSLFGLNANPVQVVIDGGDPGSNPSQGESYLDVEMAGMAAPAATVNLYVSAGSPYQDPLALAAVRAVNDNKADIISLSWGAGEQELQTSGNQFWNALWEEAAAQGQTVLVSSGDSGQVPDVNYLLSSAYSGPAVSGMASTPWNIAVGGTDFYYSDYASGAPSASTFWNATNDPVTKGSLKARLTEQAWNDPFGLDAIGNGLQRNEIGATGGGASNCSTTNTAGQCTGGYPKPGWQSGPGVPADGARDLPDISLFASNGANYSGYIICDYEGACAPDASGNFNFDIAGGTSASVQAMAGIMALVVQKYGRQGQADAVLYPLAQQKPAAFHDVTLGGNWDICDSLDQKCNLATATWTGYGLSTAFSAGAGYDQATGLGSVDAAQLVNNWGTISFAPTTTTLQAAPLMAAHGSNIVLTANVAPASGSGVPTGAVSILTNSTLPANASQTAFTLSNGTGSTSVNYLPGGIYQVTARYGGDGVYASSTSAPQTLTVSPEKSTLTMNIEGFGGVSESRLTYGMPVILSAQPVGVNSPAGSPDGAATGSVAFTLDYTTDGAALNAGGVASWTAPALSVGSHTASASYGGDASFQASSAQPLSFNIAKGTPWMNLSPSQSLWNSIYAGSSLTVSVQVGTIYGPMFSNTGPSPTGTLAPTGTVTVKLVWDNSNVLGIGCAGDTTGLAQTVALVSPGAYFGQYSTAEVVFANIPARSNGFGYMLCAQYSGDSNWVSYGDVFLNDINILTPTVPLPTPATALTITPGSITPGQDAVMTATVTAPGGSKVAPTGYISFFDNGASMNWLSLYQLNPAASGASSSVTLKLPSEYFWANGANQITAVYSGDTNYLPSTSSAVTLNVGQGGSDFSVTAQNPQITLASGATGTVGISLQAINNFSGSIGMACTPSSSQFSCSVNPTSAALSGVAPATLTINATLPGSAANVAPARGASEWWGAGATLAVCFVFVLPWQRRRMRLAWMPVLLAVFFLAGCGGSVSSAPNTPPTSGTPAGTYSVVVTGTANGIVHNAVVYVVVH